MNEEKEKVSEKLKHLRNFTGNPDAKFREPDSVCMCNYCVTTRCDPVECGKHQYTRTVKCEMTGKEQIILFCKKHTSLVDMTDDCAELQKLYKEYLGLRQYEELLPEELHRPARFDQYSSFRRYLMKFTVDSFRDRCYDLKYFMIRMDTMDKCETEYCEKILYWMKKCWDQMTSNEKEINIIKIRNYFYHLDLNWLMYIQIIEAIFEGRLP